MKVIVCGGRNLKDVDKKMFNWVCKKLKELNATELVSGMASGGDRIGIDAANHLGIPIDAYRANWKKLGPAAGHLRNQVMAIFAEACLVLPGGRGTADMQERASKMNLKIYKFTDDED